MAAWACPACTFINEADHSKCELCETPKAEAAGPSTGNPSRGSKRRQNEAQQDIVLLEEDTGQPQQQRQPKRQRQTAAVAPTTAAQDDAGPSTSSDDTCILDTCGCKHQLQQLRSKVLQMLQVQGGLLSTQQGPAAQSLGDALASVACPNCSQQLSNADAYNLLGGAAIGKVYAALYAKAKQQLGPLPTEAEVMLPVCSACNTAMLGADCLATNTGAAPSAPAQQQQQPAATAAVLRAALKARGLSQAGAKAILAERLRQAIEQAAFFCTTCAAMQDAAAAAGSAAAGPVSGAESALQLCKCAVRLCRVLTEDTGGNGGNAGSSKGGRGRPSSGSSKHAKGRGMGAAWAKGTGYSNGYGAPSKADAAAMAAASSRQSQADELCRQLLASISSQLRGRRQQWMAVGDCAMLLAGPLAFALRLLLQNDSLMDIGSRQGMYQEVLHLLRLVGANMDLVPLLQLGAVAPDGDDDDDDDGSRYSLLGVLSRLDQQCMIVKKSAEELADGDHEDVQAVGLALEISELCESLHEAAALFSATIGTSRGPLQLPSTKAAKAGKNATAAPGAAAPAAGPSRGRSKGAAGCGAADAAAAAAERAAVERRYCEALRPHVFSQAPLLAGNDHYFRGAATASKAAGGEAMRKRLRRITEELGTLSTSLPLSFDSSILLAVDEERLDVMRACFFPAPDTPYACGAFLFDILLPPNYPDTPPSVQFLTTGNGTVRFNPNLYNTGKVCLSLLGTWSGPSWQPGVSTLLQVLISLQSMVFVVDPYFNEPGFESTMSTPAGKEASRAYNETIRAATLRWAMLEPLRKPSKPFAAALKAHFTAKAQVVEALCDQWVSECKNGVVKSAMKGSAADMKRELTKLATADADAAGPAAAAAATAVCDGAGPSAARRAAKQAREEQQAQQEPSKGQKQHKKHKQENHTIDLT